MTINTISVELGDRAYDIVVGTDLLSNAGSHIAPLVKVRPVIIVTDDTVATLHLAGFRASLSPAFKAMVSDVMPAADKEARKPAK